MSRENPEIFWFDFTLFNGPDLLLGRQKDKNQIPCCSRLGIGYFGLTFFSSGISLAKFLIEFFAVPEIEVVDDRDKKTAEKYYKGGSTIELKCIVRQIVGEPPEYILWHHEDRMLNYDTERGGIRYT